MKAVSRISLCLMLALALTQTFDARAMTVAAEPSCPGLIARTVSWAYTLSKIGLKVAAAPVYFPGRYIGLPIAKGLWKIGRRIPVLGLADRLVPSVRAYSWRGIKSDIIPGAIYAAMLALDISPAHLLAEKIGVEATELFDPDNMPAWEPTLAINAIDAGPNAAPVFDHFSGASLSSDKAFVHAKPTSIDEYLESLLNVYRQSGPIQQHVLFVEDPMQEDGIKLGAQVLTPAFLKTKLAEKNLPKDLFAKDAKITVVGCFAAYAREGRHGEGPRQALADTFGQLAHLGATVTAPTRFAFVNPSKAPGRSVELKDRVTDRFKSEAGYAGYALISAYYLPQGDPTTREHRIVTIDIPAKP